MPYRPLPALPPVWRLLPPNLDLGAHLLAHPPDFAPFHRDCLVQLLHVLGEQLADRKRAAEAAQPASGEPAAGGKRRRGFAALNAARLQRYIHNYRAYLDYAVASGLVVEDARYSSGRYCRAFRFAAPYCRPGPAGGPGRLVQVDKASLLRALRTQRQRPAAGEPAQLAACTGLLGWLKACTTPLRIHAEAARAAAEALYEQRQAKPEEKLTRRGLSYRRPRYKDAAMQYRQDVLFVGRLEERDLRPGFDAQGRLYTSLAGMSKRMRQYVYAEGYGSPLVSLDIKNSQPFLCNLLLREDFYTASAAGHPERPTLASHGGPAGRLLVHLDPALGERLREMLAGTPADVAEFGAWTSGGQFYERLQAALAAAEPGRVLPHSRGALKGLLLGILYGRLDHQLPDRLVRQDAVRRANRRVFAAALPTVSAVLDAYKRHQHELLPKVLQSVEAGLMLEVVARQVSVEYPTTPIFTIHDALVVPLEYAEPVELIMRRELTRTVGYAPQVGRTVYAPPASPK